MSTQSAPNHIDCLGGMPPVGMRNSFLFYFIDLLLMTMLKGDLDSIGVFLWQAVSPINQRIRATSGMMITSSNTTNVPNSLPNETS